MKKRNFFVFYGGPARTRTGDLYRVKVAQVNNLPSTLLKTHGLRRGEIAQNSADLALSSTALVRLESRFAGLPPGRSGA